MVHSPEQSTCIHTHTRAHAHTNLLHSLCTLPCNVYQPKHIKLRVVDVEVAVEAVSNTPLCYYGEGLPRPSHEEKDVAVACLPVEKRCRV